MINKIIDKLIFGLILAILFLSPTYFAFLYKDVSVFSLDKTVLFRTIVELLFLLSVAKFILEKKIYFRLAKWQFVLPSLYIISCALATIFSYSPYTSFWGHYWRHEGLFSQIHYYLFFLIIIFNYKFCKMETLRYFIIAITSSSFFVCLYGLIQFFGFDILQWQKTLLLDRIISTLGQPNFVGAFLLLTLPITFFAILFYRKTYHSLFFSVSFILQLLVLILTYSRSAWVGFIAAFFIFIVFYFHKSKKVVCAITVALLVLGLVFFVIRNNQNRFSGEPSLNLKNRIVSMFDFSGGSTYARLKNYPMFAQLALKHPFIGFGPETMWLWFPTYYSNLFEFDNVNNYFDRSHNELLDVLLFTGIIGLIAYSGLIIYYFFLIAKFLSNKDNIKKNKFYYALIFSMLLGMIGYLVSIQFGFSITTTNIYFWFYLGLSFIMINDINNEREYVFALPTDNLNRNLNLFFLFLISVSVGFMMFKFNVSKIIADVYFYKAVEGIAEGKNYDLVNDDILKTLIFDPSEDYYRIKYADSIIKTFKHADDCQLKIKALTIAKSFLEEIPLARLENNSRLNLLRAEAYIGQCQKKIDLNRINDLAEKTLFYMPNMPKSRIDIAEIYFEMEEYGKTISYLNSSIDLFPDITRRRITSEQKKSTENSFVVVYKMLGDAYASQENWGDALQNYLKTQKYLGGQINFDLRNKISEMYIKNGKLEEAIKMDEHSLVLSNGDLYYKNKLMENFYMAKDFEKAKKYALLVLKVSPENELAKRIVSEEK